MLAATILSGWYYWLYRQHSREQSIVTRLTAKLNITEQIAEFRLRAEPVRPLWMALWAYRLGLPVPRAVEWLTVKRGSLADDDLKSLEHLHNLLGIDLFGTQVDDRGLRHLKSIPNLRYFNIKNFDIADHGLLHLGSLKALERLTLSRVVTDDGLAHLKGLRTLRELDLWSSRITDEGLAHLHELRSLRRLSLLDTEVTSEGRTAIEKAIPGLEVEIIR